MTKKLIFIFFFLLIAFSSIIAYKYKDKIFDHFNDNYYNNNAIELLEEANKYAKYYDEIKTFNEKDELKLKNKEDIVILFYSLLNRGINKYSFYCPIDYENCINDINEISRDKEILNLIDNYINPFNSFLNYNISIDNREVNIDIIKVYSDAEITKVNNEIDIIFDKLNISFKDSNETNIKKIHDYLLEHITYDEDYKIEENVITDSNKATGALIDGKCVCSGYADSLAIMLDRLNIPNFMVSNEEHVWNVVYINGSWKHLDATWNDDEVNPNNTSNFYLINNEELMSLDTKKHNFNKNLYIEIKNAN